MKANQLLFRFFTGLATLPKHWLSVINDLGRDVENRRRFPYASIDSGVCLTKDTILGSHCHVASNCIVNHSSIGKYSYVCRNGLIQNTTIGNYCSISNDVLCGLGSHPLGRFSTSPLFYRKNNPLKCSLVDDDKSIVEYKQVSIGSDVWVGARTVILDGVSIGHGAVIAAGAVVTKDVPPYAIVGGIPATILKYRFQEEDASRLLESKWWEMDPEKAMQYMASVMEEISMKIQ